MIGIEPRQHPDSGAGKGGSRSDKKLTHVSRSPGDTGGNLGGKNLDALAALKAKMESGEGEKAPGDSSAGNKAKKIAKKKPDPASSKKPGTAASAKGAPKSGKSKPKSGSAKKKPITATKKRPDSGGGKKSGPDTKEQDPVPADISARAAAAIEEVVAAAGGKKFGDIDFGKFLDAFRAKKVFSDEDLRALDTQLPDGVQRESDGRITFARKVGYFKNRYRDQQRMLARATRTKGSTPPKTSASRPKKNPDAAPTKPAHKLGLRPDSPALAILGAVEEDSRVKDFFARTKEYHHPPTFGQVIEFFEKENIITNNDQQVLDRELQEEKAFTYRDGHVTMGSLARYIAGRNGVARLDGDKRRREEKRELKGAYYQKKEGFEGKNPWKNDGDYVWKDGKFQRQDVIRSSDFGLTEEEEEEYVPSIEAQKNNSKRAWEFKKKEIISAITKWQKEQPKDLSYEEKKKQLFKDFATDEVVHPSAFLSDEEVRSFLLHPDFKSKFEDVKKSGNLDEQRQRVFDVLVDSAIPGFLEAKKDIMPPYDSLKKATSFGQKLGSIDASVAAGTLDDDKARELKDLLEQIADHDLGLVQPQSEPLSELLQKVIEGSQEHEGVQYIDMDEIKESLQQALVGEANGFAFSAPSVSLIPTDEGVNVLIKIDVAEPGKDPETLLVDGQLAGTPGSFGFAAGNGDGGTAELRQQARVWLEDTVFALHDTMPKKYDKNPEDVNLLLYGNSFVMRDLEKEDDNADKQENPPTFAEEFAAADDAAKLEMIAGIDPTDTEKMKVVMAYLGTELATAKAEVEEANAELVAAQNRESEAVEDIAINFPDDIQDIIKSAVNGQDQDGIIFNETNVNFGWHNTTEGFWNFRISTSAGRAQGSMKSMKVDLKLQIRDDGTLWTLPNGGFEKNEGIGLDLINAFSSRFAFDAPWNIGGLITQELAQKYNRNPEGITFAFERDNLVMKVAPLEEQDTELKEETVAPTVEQPKEQKPLITLGQSALEADEDPGKQPEEQKPLGTLGEEPNTSEGSLGTAPSVEDSTKTTIEKPNQKVLDWAAERIAGIETDEDLIRGEYERLASQYKWTPEKMERHVALQIKWNKKEIASLNSDPVGALRAKIESYARIIEIAKVEYTPEEVTKWEGYRKDLEDLLVDDPTSTTTTEKGPESKEYTPDDIVLGCMYGCGGFDSYKEKGEEGLNIVGREIGKDERHHYKEKDLMAAKEENRPLDVKEKQLSTGQKVLSVYLPSYDIVRPGLSVSMVAINIAIPQEYDIDRVKKIFIPKLVDEYYKRENLYRTFDKTGGLFMKELREFVPAAKVLAAETFNELVKDTGEGEESAPDPLISTLGEIISAEDIPVKEGGATKEAEPDNFEIIETEIDRQGFGETLIKGLEAFGVRVLPENFSYEIDQDKQQLTIAIKKGYSASEKDNFEGHIILELAHSGLITKEAWYDINRQGSARFGEHTITEKPDDEYSLGYILYHNVQKLLNEGALQEKYGMPNATLEFQKGKVVLVEKKFLDVTEDDDTAAKVAFRRAHVPPSKK